MNQWYLIKTNTFFDKNLKLNFLNTIKTFFSKKQAEP